MGGYFPLDHFVRHFVITWRTLLISRAKPSACMLGSYTAVRSPPIFLFNLRMALVPKFPTVKGVNELIHLFEPTTLSGGYLSIFIAILYFGSIYSLEKLGSSAI
jgi:hypothetical protein